MEENVGLLAMDGHVRCTIRVKRVWRSCDVLFLAVLVQGLRRVGLDGLIDHSVRYKLIRYHGLGEHTVSLNRLAFGTVNLKRSASGTECCNSHGVAVLRLFSYLRIVNDLFRVHIDVLDLDFFARYWIANPLPCI